MGEREENKLAFLVEETQISRVLGKHATVKVSFEKKRIHIEYIQTWIKKIVEAIPNAFVPGILEFRTIERRNAAHLIDAADALGDVDAGA